jgi:protein-tyrosine kinase
MSRIEEAMEKARQLRGQSAPPVPPGKPAETSAAPRYQNVADQIKIENPRLVAANDYSLPVAEEYRKFKSIIAQITKSDRPHYTLMVASSIGGEGKSVTALNLAISLAQEYDNFVVLIDADLRNPSICKYLGLDNKTGLAECLIEGTDVREVLLDTGLGNLIFLPAGKRMANPVELLSSQKMKDLLARIKLEFPRCYIIFDTSPVLPFADPRIISTLVDGVIFVVKEGGPSFKNINAALESLKDTNVLGLVYNKATTEGLGGGYHYYYYDYYKKPRSLDKPAPVGKTGFLSRLFRPKGTM